MRLLFLACIGLAACAPSTPATTTAPAPAPAQPRAQVMILGAYHFDDPGNDLVKTAPDDHLSARRQAEIADVVARLARFAPTKILVEAVDQAKLTARFTAGGPLAASEVDQLGIRLARQLKLPGVHAIDHRIGMDFERLMAAANASGDRVFLDAFRAVIATIEGEVAARRDRTVRETLVAMNDPAMIARDGEAYLVATRVKHGDDFAGADVVAGWYQRNFRIFANLAATVTSPDDRVLVIFGRGHAAILRELVRASPNLVLVDPNAYLAGD